MALTASKVSAELNINDVRSGDLSSARYNLGQVFGWDIGAGVGADQCNLVFADTRTVLTAATDDVDVSDALSDIFGLCVFTKVKFIAMQASPLNTTILTVTFPAAVGLPFLLASGDGFTLEPGDIFLLTRRNAGWNVVVATGDIIRVVNAAGASASYNIGIGGLS